MERLVPRQGQKVRNKRNYGYVKRVLPSGDGQGILQLAAADEVGGHASSESVSRLPRRFGALGLSWVGARGSWGSRVSMTQKSIYRMEQGTHDLRRSTVVMVEQVL